MATYKVIQDIEAEDKLVGPLGFRALLYAAGAAFLAFISFRIIITTGLGPVRWLLVPIFLLPMFLLAILALPLGREQPTEVWLLSRVRFMMKPKRRTWDQDGIGEFVTITAPKQTEHKFTKGLSPTEVHSRLKALATTLDSRGWAMKNENVNLNPQLGYLQEVAGETDRLIDTAELPQEVPIIDIHASEDILDEKNNPTAQKFEQLMQESDAKRRNEILHKIYPHQDFEEVPPPKNRKHSYRSQPLEPKKKRVGKVIDPEGRRDEIKGIEVPLPKMTHLGRADKLELAQSGNDLTVASIASLANRRSRPEQSGSGEVVVSLH